MKNIALYSFVMMLIAALCGCPMTSTSMDRQNQATLRGPEGHMIVNKVSLSHSLLVAGQKNVDVLSFSVEAKQSDLLVQRVRLDLGSEKEVYTNFIREIRIVDSDGKTHGFAELNNNTVVYDSGNYYLTIGGFEALVQKDAKKYFMIKADVRDGIVSQNMLIFKLPVYGVRAVDFAKIDQYGPSGGSIAQNISIEPNRSAKL